MEKSIWPWSSRRRSNSSFASDAEGSAKDNTLTPARDGDTSPAKRRTTEPKPGSENRLSGLWRNFRDGSDKTGQDGPHIREKGSKDGPRKEGVEDDGMRVGRRLKKRPPAAMETQRRPSALEDMLTSRAPDLPTQKSRSRSTSKVRFADDEVKSESTANDENQGKVSSHKDSPKSRRLSLPRLSLDAVLRGRDSHNQRQSDVGTPSGNVRESHGSEQRPSPASSGTKKDAYNTASGRSHLDDSSPRNDYTSHDSYEAGSISGMRNSEVRSKSQALTAPQTIKNPRSSEHGSEEATSEADTIRAPDHRAVDPEQQSIVHGKQIQSGTPQNEFIPPTTKTRQRKQDLGYVQWQRNQSLDRAIAGWNDECMVVEANKDITTGSVSTISLDASKIFSQNDDDTERRSETSLDTGVTAEQDIPPHRSENGAQSRRWHFKHGKGDDEPSSADNSVEPDLSRQPHKSIEMGDIKSKNDIQPRKREDQIETKTKTKGKSRATTKETAPTIVSEDNAPQFSKEGLPILHHGSNIHKVSEHLHSQPGNGLLKTSAQQRKRPPTPPYHTKPAPRQQNLSPLRPKQIPDEPPASLSTQKSASSIASSIQAVEIFDNLNGKIAGFAIVQDRAKSMTAQSSSGDVDDRGRTYARRSTQLDKEIAERPSPPGRKDATSSVTDRATQKQPTTVAQKRCSNGESSARNSEPFKQPQLPYNQTPQSAVPGSPLRSSEHIDEVTTPTESQNNSSLRRTSTFRRSSVISEDIPIKTKLGAKPIEKILTVCCRCRRWLDIPDEISHLDSQRRRVQQQTEGTANEQDRRQTAARKAMGIMSNKMGTNTAELSCPWCQHALSSSCCTSWKTLVHLQARAY